MELFYIIPGLSMMFAGTIISSVIAFGGMKTAPQWLRITAGVMNLFLLLAFIGMSK